MKHLVTALASAGILALGAAAHATTIIATFDTDAEGFTVDGFGLAHQSSGGNPGGYLRLNDNAGGYATLTPGGAFFGALTPGATLSFDATLFSANGSSTTEFGEITLAGGGFTATVDAAIGVPPTGSWETYAVSLEAATWGLAPGDFAAMLASLDTFSLVIETTLGVNEVIGIDNFAVTETVVPIPAAAFLFAPLAGAAVLRRRRLG